MSASYLALDVATTSGWAHWRDEMEWPQYGSFRCQSAELGDRSAEFSDWLMAMIAAQETTEIGIEPPVPVAFGATNITTTIWLQGAYLRVLEIAARRRIEVLPISESAWRSHFLGVTRAPPTIKDKNKRRTWLKRRCIDECRARGFGPKNDNEADALAVLHYLGAMRSAAFASLPKPMLMGQAA